jgi:hypothetical protein
LAFFLFYRAKHPKAIDNLANAFLFYCKNIDFF